MSEEKKPAEKVEAAKPAEATEAPKAEAPKKEKKPMDPKKKKNIIIWSCVGGVVLIGAIVAIVLVIVLSKVDYKESYDIVKKLSTPMNEFYYDYGDCKDVADDVDDDWASIASYTSDISDCKSAISTETTELIKQLGGTSGVSRDSDIKPLYDKFYAEYSKAIEGVDGETAKKLDIYESWHKFVYNADGYSFYSTNQDKINEVANYAINSGHDTLKAFGEQWKEKATEVYKARKAYDDATSNYSSLYNDYTSKKNALDDWYEDNVPKAGDLIGLKFEGDKYNIDDAWENLSAAVAKKYGEKAAEDIINGNSSYEDLINELLK